MQGITEGKKGMDLGVLFGSDVCVASAKCFSTYITECTQLLLNHLFMSIVSLAIFVVLEMKSLKL